MSKLSRTILLLNFLQNTHFYLIFIIPELCQKGAYYVIIPRTSGYPPWEGIFLLNLVSFNWNFDSVRFLWIFGSFFIHYLNCQSWYVGFFKAALWNILRRSFAGMLDGHHFLTTLSRLSLLFHVDYLGLYVKSLINFERLFCLDIC